MKYEINMKFDIKICYLVIEMAIDSLFHILTCGWQ